MHDDDQDPGPLSPAGAPAGGAEEDNGTGDLQPTRRGLLLRLAAGLLAAAMAVVVLGGVPRVLALPPLDFLAEALRLDQDASVRRWQEAVVLVTARNSAGGARTGTGFNIRPSGLVITNRHVVEGARSVEIRFRDGTVYPAAEVRVDDAADLALVRLNGADLPVVPLGEPHLPPTGSGVTVVGNPLGYPRLAVRGTVLGYAGQGPEPVMEIDAPIHSGHSGSPVFNEEGNVVGVVFGASAGDGGGRTGYAVPSTALHRFLAVEAP